MVAHHTRKPTAGANGGGTVDDGRGATALANAARASRNLNNMTKEECEDARIDEKDRRYYFRMDLGRTNLSPPAERADWFKLVSVDLENNPDLPGPGGDEIGVVTAWEYPSADEVGVSVADIKRVQDAIATGAWRRDQRAKQRWVGIPIAHTFKRDIAIKQDRQWVERHIRLWILSGLLAVEKRPDPNVKNRESVEFVVVGRPPTPADAVEVF
jgi:hypothetical protein